MQFVPILKNGRTSLHRSEWLAPERVTVDRLQSQPSTDQLDTGAVGVVLSWIRRASDAAIAAETILRHDWPTGAIASELADATEADLRQAAVVMRSDDYSPELDEQLSRPTALARKAIDQPTGDRVAALMARAEVSASAALRASHQVVIES